MAAINSERLYEHPLPDLMQWFTQMAPQSDWNDPLLLDACQMYLARRSPEVQRLLGVPETPASFWEKWDQLNSATQAICQVARPRWDTKGNYITEPGKRLFGGALLKVSVHIIVKDGKGAFDVEENPVLKALIGTNLGHIRSCIVCNKIFWAPRDNSLCCSLKCSRIHHQRTSRDARARALLRKSKHEATKRTKKTTGQ
jgi:hypothetical protein